MHKHKWIIENNSIVSNISLVCIDCKRRGTIRREFLSKSKTIYPVMAGDYLPEGLNSKVSTVTSP